MADIVKDNINILMKSESKLDDSFPESHFMIEGFGKASRLDRNRNGVVSCCLFEAILLPKSFLQKKVLTKDFTLN